MGFLLILALLIIIVWAANRNGKKTKSTPNTPEMQRLNQQWIDFIATYAASVTSAKEKTLLRHMLEDIRHQGLGEPSEALGNAVAAAAVVNSDSVTEAPVFVPNLNPVIPTASTSTPIDNATLLLYFGAFLFVASVGLFIGFGGASGILRAVAVLFVMIVMYTGGIWLYKNRPKLQQAGMTFVGIGIVIAPLVGLGFYNYVFDHQHGSVIWMVTSMLCLGLYLHALVTIKKPLLSYLLIFTFLSLFESSISVISAPIYYMGWGLAAVGIGLQLLNLWRGYWPELKESSRQSSLVLLPLSILVSIVMVPSHGAGQLGIALLLAAAFYGLQAFTTKDKEQEESAVATQVLSVAAVACLAYSSSHNYEVTAFAVLAINIVQVFILAAFKVSSRLWQNFSSVLMLSGGVAILLSITHPTAMLATTAGLTFSSLAIWVRQKRAEAYAIAALSFVSLPFIYSLQIEVPVLSASVQTGLAALALLVVLVSYLMQYKASHRRAGWLAAAQVSYFISALAVLTSSYFGSPLLCLAVAVGIVASLAILAERDHTTEWAEVAGALLAVPLIRAWSDSSILLLSITVVLATVLILALRYRKESLRWESTALWLLTPLILGHSSLGQHWKPSVYAAAYLVVMFVLIFSRAIARGVVLFSTNRVLASYARNASLSYVVGYVIAAGAAVAYSATSANSHVYTTAILVLLIVTTLYVSRYIEKRTDTLILIPALAQATLLSLIQPWTNTAHLNTFLVSSSVLALGSYWAVLTYESSTDKKHSPKDLLETCLVTLFITPFAVVFVGHTTWPMPFGLLAAALATFYHVRDFKQDYRELAGVLVSLSVAWLFQLAGVHQLQAYTHIGVATLAIYAYWRAQLGQVEMSDNYLKAMLALATVPLALQALGGSAGGLYGWWLLLEQIVFMLLGMAIKKRFVTLWGLYVAVADVLYQLRHLGWAALTLLATFLIGLALYQLQKHSDK